MSFNTFTNISVFLILPILLESLGSSTSSLTRVYVNSGTFFLSILLGALVTTNFYTLYLKNRRLRYTLIFIFGVVTPILYIQSSYVIYGSGFQVYSEIWSPIYSFTTLIGLLEIILYIGIFFILFMRMTRFLFKSITSMTSKKRIIENNPPQSNIKWSWAEGEVDTTKEYIELCYGKSFEEEHKNWISVAYIAPPKNNIFYVQFLIKESDELKEHALKEAKRELNFYLIELDRLDPWEYAIYHCSTAANIYSNIHWSFFSPKPKNEKK